LLLILGTDGSGGEHSSDRRLRSCGWGVCWVKAKPRIEALFGLAGSLPFTTQTVPLAELYALFQAVTLSPEADVLQIFVDASYVVDNYNKGPKHCLAYVSHAALRCRVFDRVADLESRGVCVIVTKVKAHNEDGKHEAVGAHTFANIVADTLADSAACFNQVLNMDRVSDAARMVQELDSTALLVIRRLTKLGLQNARDLGRRLVAKKKHHKLLSQCLFRHLLLRQFACRSCKAVARIFLCTVCFHLPRTLRCVAAPPVLVVPRGLRPAAPPVLLSLTSLPVPKLCSLGSVMPKATATSAAIGRSGPGGSLWTCLLLGNTSLPSTSSLHLVRVSVVLGAWRISRPPKSPASPKRTRAARESSWLWGPPPSSARRLGFP
jgi:hypothetical protein